MIRELFSGFPEFPQRSTNRVLTLPSPPRNKELTCYLKTTRLLAAKVQFDSNIQGTRLEWKVGKEIKACWSSSQKPPLVLQARHAANSHGDACKDFSLPWARNAPFSELCGWEELENVLPFSRLSDLFSWVSVHNKTIKTRGVGKEFVQLHPRWKFVTINHKCSAWRSNAMSGGTQN